MGLDSMWKMPDESDPHPEFDPPVNLCGGMLSGHGAESFRGKVYSPLIEELCGQECSLYQDEMTNDRVLYIAETLEKFMKAADTEKCPCCGEKPATVCMPPDTWFLKPEFTVQELHDLARVFRVYGDAGATLHGWW